MVFINPVTLNDGTADRSFAFRAQITDKSGKSIVGEWIEPAAPIADDSKITIRHDVSSTKVRRRNMRVSSMALVDATTRKMLTVNISIAYDPSHNETDITKHFKLAIDAASEATFLSNFIRGLV